MEEAFELIPGNAQDVGSRGEQQDAFGFSDAEDGEFLCHGGLLVVVADGMGGLAGGQLASQVAVGAFLTAYGGKAMAETVPEALLRSLRVANAAVLAAALQQGAAGNMGTTLVAAVVLGNRLYWISVGDSRLYLLRAGRLTQISTDHTYGTSLGQAVAEGRMARGEALAELGRNESQAGHLTSYVGCEELVQIDRTKRGLPLELGDVVVACTDGVYRTLSAGEMAVALAARDGCARVLEAALGKRCARQDNLTIAAIGCGELAEAEGSFAGRTLKARRLILAMACCVAMTVCWLVMSWVGGKVFPGKAATADAGPVAIPVAIPVAGPGGQAGRKKPSAGKLAVVGDGRGPEEKAAEPAGLDSD